MQSAPTSPFLRIGTRGSALAMVQAEAVRDLLAVTHGVSPSEIEIIKFSTAGDRTQSQNVSLSTVGGKGVFSKELESALSNGEIDIAVHSSKDMATELPHNLFMPFFLPREEVRDAFISPIAATPAELPIGATIGSSSLRRRAQMLRMRPDLNIVEYRGNVGTRLKKLEEGVVDATLLAGAGLNRLGLSEHVTSWLDPRLCPPAPAQGAIGIELRMDDTRCFELCQPLNDPETAEAVRAERAMLAVLDGSCRTPIGAHSIHSGVSFSLFGQILSPDGTQVFEAELSGAWSQAEELGTALGHRLLELAGPEFIARLKSETA